MRSRGSRKVSQEVRIRRTNDGVQRPPQSSIIVGTTSADGVFGNTSTMPDSNDPDRLILLPVKDLICREWPHRSL
jgi:hypothetical protein